MFIVKQFTMEQDELLRRQADELRSYKSQVEKLTNELSWLKRQVFGSKGD